MPHSRLLRKQITGLSLILVPAVVLVAVLADRQIRAAAMDETYEALRAHGALLAGIAEPALRDGDIANLRERLVDLARDLDVRLTVVAADGVVLADSRDAPSARPNESGRETFRQALIAGTGQALEMEPRGGGAALSSAVRLGPAGAPDGVVRASMSLAAVERRLAGKRLLLLLGVGIVLPVAWLVGLSLARRLAGPLVELAEVAETLAAGEQAPRQGVRSADAVDRLAAALNRIGDSSAARLADLGSERNRVLAILSGMVEGVVAIDDDERVVHINTAAARILRTEPSAAGQRIWEITRVREVSEALSESLREQVVVNREARIVMGQDELVVGLHAAPLEHREGRPGGAVVVLHDITALRRLEDVRRDFVANVSHELKTPLTAIGALVETLIDDQAMDADTHRRFLVKICDQCARLSAMVRDLLDLSRIESRQVQSEMETLDLRPVVATTVRMMATGAEHRRIDLDVALPESPVLILGDAEALRQLVSNLLENAVKYTPEGGCVRVQVDSEGGQAFVEVQDDGMGIEPSHHERIFERFYRVDKGRSRDVGGTGLGLSIVKHIALTHSGGVTVRSSPGEGSTFRVTLPLTAAAV